MRLTRKILADRKGLAAAIVAVVALGATAGVTLGGFSATIENPTNTFSSGTVQLEEGVSGTTCYSTGTGSGGPVSAANKDANCTGDDLGDSTLNVPGGTPVATDVTLTNVGNTPTSSSELAVGTCAVSNASGNGGYDGTDTTGYCGEVDVTIENETTGFCVYPYSATNPCSASPTSADTLASLATAATLTNGMSGLGAGDSAEYVITAELDAGATNADQGLTATIPFTWSITQ